MKENNITQIYSVDIFDIDSQGRGVGRLEDGQIVFVPFALCNESVTVEITETKKSYALAKLISITNQSNYRCNPKCPCHFVCGGCDLQHLDYQGQLEYKTKLIRDGLKRNVKIDDDIVNACVPSKQPFNYRNKAQFKIDCRDGKVSFGFFEEGSHIIKDTEYCYICNLHINDALKNIKAFLSKELSFVKHLTEISIRSLGNSVLINLHSQVLNLPKINEFVQYLKSNTYDFGLFVTCLDKNKKVSKFKHIAGIERLKGSIGEISFEASVHSFLQVNTEVAQELYLAAASFFDDTDFVIDAYCGIGILTALLSKKAKKVCGIEIIEAATTDARNLLKSNNIENSAIITGDCSLVMTDIFNNNATYDRHNKVGVLLDPPRKGCSKEVIDSLLKYMPQKIAYISCDPATLFRDLQFLKSKYRIVSISPYDMFPQTSKVETLTLLQL